MSTTKKLMAVGTRVRMSAIGKKAYSNERYNPHDLEGTLTANDNSGDWIYAVKWDNRCTNDYKINEIEPVEKTSEMVADKIANRLVGELSKKVRESVEESFEIIHLGVDKIYCGDWFIYQPSEGCPLEVYESDETQTDPDSDNEYSAIGDYIDANLVLAAFRLSGAKAEDLEQSELQAIVDASPQKLTAKAVELSKEDIEVLRTFAPNAKSGAEFISKVRKTKTVDLTEVLEVLDKLFE